MANYETILLGRITDNNAYNKLIEFDMKEHDFVTEAGQKAFKFIKEYYENYNKTPSTVVLLDNIDDFPYVPSNDDYGYLAKMTKNWSAGVTMAEYSTRMQENFDKYSQSDMLRFIEITMNDLELLKTRASISTKVGTNVKDIETYKEEYLRRKEGKVSQVWHSKFKTINQEIGGYTCGDMYTWFGKSGRGKSTITTAECVHAARHGARVLIWTMEMARFEVISRIYSMLSADIGKVTVTIDDLEYIGGFNNNELRTGNLEDKDEQAFFTMLEEINDEIRGEIIIRSVDDEDFYDRKLNRLKSDIQNTRADIVMIDPFYYLDYERNTSKTAGGDAAHTSIKLKRLAGQMQVVIHVITQADEVNEKSSDVERELVVPARKDVKKTKQVLEDATCLFAIDTNYKQKRGIISIQKGRNGGEGTEIDITYLPNYGIIKETLVDVSDFNF